MFLLLNVQGLIFAQEKQDSLRIYFHQGKSRIDLQFKGNKSEVERFVGLFSNPDDTISAIGSIQVIGAASPEGDVEFNRGLSERRADALVKFLTPYVKVPVLCREAHYLGRDWGRLLEMVQEDENVPARQEVLQILQGIVSSDKDGSRGGFLRLKNLRRGKPYSYLYKHHFPELRYSLVKLSYRKPKEKSCLDKVFVHHCDTVYVRDTVFIEVEKPKPPFYIAVKTNMLYDALLVPNVGLEVYLGKRWSLAANWMYAWWKSDRNHNYWRVYGGNAEARLWFGSKALEKPLTGHHIGLYGQILTYDLELGGRGYLGDKWSYGFGISYGYSLPVAERLNIDFSLGLGYFGGVYKEYEPIDNHYVWQKTCRRNWIGPTKAEVSLVWLIGRGNRNGKKGGKR